jgi:hypothetical protein
MNLIYKFQNIWLDIIISFGLLFILLSLFNNLGECRILIFFIYFELVLLLLILILLVHNDISSLYFFYNFSWEYRESAIIFVFFIIGTSGAETAMLLVLFITYYRITGLTVFKSYR